MPRTPSIPPSTDQLPAALPPAHTPTCPAPPRLSRPASHNLPPTLRAERATNEWATSPRTKTSAIGHGANKETPSPASFDAGLGGNLSEVRLLVCRPDCDWAVRTGLEPVTPCVTGMYSNQAELTHLVVCRRAGTSCALRTAGAKVRIFLDCATNGGIFLIISRKICVDCLDDEKKSVYLVP